VTGNLSARPAERDVEVQVALPGIQPLLADTEDATTGEMVTSWPGSDGPPVEPYGAGIRYLVAAPERVTVMDMAVAMVPRSHRYLATRNQAAPPGRSVTSPGSAGHVRAAAAGVAQRQGDAVRVQPDLRVPVQRARPAS